MNRKTFDNNFDDDILLMELGFHYDKRRIKGFLQNPSTSDSLFFKLLKIYSWQEKGFFEESDNSDVSTALIQRVYKDFNNNQYKEYHTQEFAHLITNCNEPSIIESIVNLEPLQRSLKSDVKDVNFAIINAIASHPMTPRNVLEVLIENSNAHVRTLIAMRADCDASMQNALYESEEETVLEVLSHNVMLDSSIAIKLLFTKIYGKNVAKHIQLSEEIFEILEGIYSVELAHNNSLDVTMQKRLAAFGDEETRATLAFNENLDDYVMAQLVFEGSEEISYETLRENQLSATTEFLPLFLAL